MRRRGREVRDAPGAVPHANDHVAVARENGVVDEDRGRAAEKEARERWDLMLREEASDSRGNDDDPIGGRKGFLGGDANGGGEGSTGSAGGTREDRRSVLER